MITLEQYFMGRDEKYKDELTEEIKESACVLVESVNALLEILEIEKADVSSGWRPTAINKNVGGAKASRHLTGEAVDLADPKKTLASKILGRTDVLADTGLYMENPNYTKTWVHLQSVPPKSGRLIFVP